VVEIYKFRFTLLAASFVYLLWAHSWTLTIEKVFYSEMLSFHQITRRHIQEDNALQTGELMEIIWEPTYKRLAFLSRLFHDPLSIRTVQIQREG
jgi:hypothetical protein